METKRYKEEIEDFRNWKSAEASYRIIGNIKRLNRIGVSDINLSGCYLREMDLSGLDLRNANLTDTDLQDVNLKSVDLRGASGVTIENLGKAKTLFCAHLDPAIEAQVREKCRHLLEK